LRFDGKINLIDRAEDLIDFPDRSLVFQIDGSVKVRDFGVDGFAHDFTFARMHETAHF